MPKKSSIGSVNVDHKDWFNYLVQFRGLVNAVVIFASQTILLRLLTFQIESLILFLTIRLFWFCFTLLSEILILQWIFHHSKVLIMLSFSFNGLLTKIKGRSSFYHTAFFCSCNFSLSLFLFPLCSRSLLGYFFYII